MSDSLQVECGPADEFGRRSVTATCGRSAHRDRFNTDDAFRRRQFAEATLTKFQWAISADVLAQIDELVVRESAAHDAEGAGSRLQPRVRRLSDVPPSQVEWLWPGRIALGAVTMLAGDPGLGKSFVTLDMAARVSRGRAWPDERQRGADTERGRQGDACVESLPSESPPLSVSVSPPLGRPPSSVVLLSAEDDLSKTIRPRLDALGADCYRVQVLEGIEGRDNEGVYTRPFEMSRDLAHLTTAIEAQGDCRLVVIDPISAYLGHVSENANAEVRRLLAPLAELASKYNLAVVAVSHLRKEDSGAMYRTMGSMAFVAAARASWMIVRDPDNSRRRLMLPVKNNLAEDVHGLAFTIEPLGPHDEPVVCWAAEPVQLSIDAAASSPRQPAHRPDVERQQVTEWLRAYLAPGAQLSTHVHEAAAAHGFSTATLRRAFRALGGEAVKRRGEQHGGWMWRLPPQDVQETQNSDPVVLSNLSSQDAPNTVGTEGSALNNLES